MQLVLLDGANFDHWLPSCCRALVSSLTQLFRDWSTVSPAVAARSSLQLRTMSNVGTRSATVTTSCELKAIIETERGISYLPYVWSHSETSLTLAAAARKMDCAINGGEQRAFLQRLQKKGYQFRVLLKQANVAVRGNYYCRNVEAN